MQFVKSLAELLDTAERVEAWNRDGRDGPRVNIGHSFPLTGWRSCWENSPAPFSTRARIPTWIVSTLPDPSMASCPFPLRAGLPWDYRRMNGPT